MTDRIRGARRPHARDPVLLALLNAAMGVGMVLRSVGSD